ncbi:MAG: hypothetical protein ACJ8EY_08070 [Sphingomicrobium sp.]
MANTADVSGRGRSNRWRIAGWSIPVALLALPFIAMQIGSHGVRWTFSDFIVMGALFVFVGAAFEMFVRLSPSLVYRAAAGLALLATFLVVWVNLAVGIIGSEHNPSNLMYFGLCGIGIVATLLVRGGPAAMARITLGMGVGQVLVTAMALIVGRDEPFTSVVPEMVGNCAFAGLWLMSAWLFSRAAREPASK